ncbi:MAG: hypothetical protein ABSB61_11180 [Anaerolineales bacterium]
MKTASPTRLRRDNKEDAKSHAPVRDRIFFIFVAVSVRLATVTAYITWKKVPWPRTPSLRKWAWIGHAPSSYYGF